MCRRLLIVFSAVLLSGGLMPGCAGGGSTHTPSSQSALGSVATGGVCTSDKDCVAGNECQKGICAADNEGEDSAKGDGGGEKSEGTDDGKGDGGVEAEDDGGEGPEATCATPCPTGQECEDGVCVAKETKKP